MRHRRLPRARLLHVLRSFPRRGASAWPQRSGRSSRRLRRPRRLHGAAQSASTQRTFVASLRRTTRAAKAELERFGGTVEKFIGDAVVAVFGAPIAHEDDAERAVRAALAVRDAISELNADDPCARTVRSRRRRHGRGARQPDARPEQGEQLRGRRRAQHRLAAAERGSARTGSSSTRRLAGLTRERHRVSRGRIRSLRRARRTPSRRGSPSRRRPASGWTSRSAEALRSSGERRARALLDAVARSQRDRAPQLVTLVGVPGIGKSRLVWELFAALALRPGSYVTWRQGRSLPYGDGVAFWALGEMTKAQAGILESDDARGGRSQASRGGRYVSPTRSRRPAGWKATCGRSRASERAREPGGDHGRTEAFAAWRRFFEALAEHRSAHPRLRGSPLGGRRPARLRRLHGGMDERCAARLLCTARPELLDRTPGLGRRQAQRDDDLARAALRCGDRLLLSSLLDERGPGAEGRSRAPDSRRRQSTLCGGVRAHARARPRRSCRFRSRSRGSSRRGSTRSRPTRRPSLQAAAIVGKVFWPGAARG